MMMIMMIIIITLKIGQTVVNSEYIIQFNSYLLTFRLNSTIVNYGYKHNKQTGQTHKNGTLNKQNKNNK